jgi:hypothetical protein
LWVLRNRRAADQDIADEVTHHLEEAAAAFVAKGLSPDEALRAARMELGCPTALREQMRAYGWENRIDSLVSDLRYAGRGLAADRGFTTVAILTLGLGIGASTAIFSLVDAVLLRALPYPDPQEIVRVWEQAPNGHRMNLADPNFDDFRTQNDTFRTLAIYSDGLTSVSGGSEPVRVHWAEVSSGFFKALGISPFRGRAFGAAEQSLHGAPAVIVSYGYWRNYLGGADLSGLHLTTGDAVYSIVGVMPEGFDFPPASPYGVLVNWNRSFPAAQRTTGVASDASATESASIRRVRISARSPAESKRVTAIRSILIMPRSCLSQTRCWETCGPLC